MRTRGETEAAICNAISRFEQEYMGRGPREVHAYFIDHLLVVRLQGVLTAAEQNLVKTLPPEKGRDLLKQVRTQLLDHDISTVTGEELVIFTLADLPQFRDIKKK